MSKQLIPAQRREQIRKYLEIYRVARSADLCNMLGVSEATIRRDLEWLEDHGILERTHGGAVLSQRIPLESEYAQRAHIHPEEKLSIGALVATLVEDGDVIFINSGTSTTQVISHIPSNARVTVITNNVRAVLDAREVSFKIILPGGSFWPRSDSVMGRFATDILRQVYANKAFIGVDGISLKYGCTVPTDGEAEIVRLMIQRTRGPVTVVADHSKWGVVSNFEVATIDQIHRFVTDDVFNASARAELAAHSIDVLIAGTGQVAEDRDSIDS